MECKFCGRIIKNKGSLAAHEMCCEENPNRIRHKRSPLAGQKKGCVPWNKGLSKETDIRVKKLGETISARYQSGELVYTPLTEKGRKSLSEKAKQRGLGGYVIGSGGGKRGWYKGIWCDSSWELAYLLYCIDHSMQIERCKEKRTYIWKGETKEYTPDFVVEGNVVEIKGYKSPVWKAKLSCNPDVEVLYKDDMEPILKYVKETYGNDFIRLYE